ncbi:Six-hairpin glycosidase [Aspergillus pseudodeflectus]|uniref:Mannan endo-1,6-alpha-mannosidase n=1 Tax=Aspergillus pseudodeflectus TaxID=176178 RepID=A0ABR4JXT3_9EURO
MLLPILSATTLALSTRALAATNTTTAQSRALAAANTLQTWYNSATGIWNTCGWWNGANCMTTLANLAALHIDDTFNDVARGVFANTFAVAATVSNPIPGRGNDAASYLSSNGTGYYPATEGVPTGAANTALWLDGSYDDDLWWGLAWVAAYDATSNTDYLDLAEGTFYHLSNAWPSKCGNGGIDSNYEHVYVGAIANELFLSLAAHLANRAEDSAFYRDWAQRQWAWFQDSGLINENNTINDGLTNDCTNNGQTIWSYNQGVILGGLVELHRASGDDSDSDSNSSSNSTYLDAAGEIARGAIAELADENHVLHDACEPAGCAPDATQFKGIFMRNLRALHAVAPDDIYAEVIEASAESIWANDRTDVNALGVVWAGPVDAAVVDASTHSSALDALVAAIEK